MKPYKIRRSKIDNLGLYATKDITSGSKIIEYKGKVITRKEAEENPKYDNEKEIFLSENQSTFIPLGSKHRLINPGKIPLLLIEVQSGSYLGEDDIKRFADSYGRLN